ncbi:MAG TPA: peptidoglycan editing factor PgeF [Methylomusa anaerophila]|uniref:Purine nucleoside phosphorylase n=1 Tax=Methylomusa anaerophila TaxID=1930071 RepID=A0A348APJ7_9FIRM|nr:peptidoglycan editing factor PgeF [Methylomusa anaerophila]BBB92995.1 laccase domain protein [Methylomusa anaerophila]HML87172.1 peptidoglycan editing factor PgeF [Methylomusa anaerophila]
MEEFLLRQAKNSVWYGFFTHLTRKGVVHGISTRLGGVSQLPYASLNLGLHTGDCREDVWTNRSLFCKSLGLNASDAVTAEQTHGDQVWVVNNEDKGKGARNYSDSIRGTDALITNVSHLPLMLFYADCVPVIIYDPVKKAIGVSHAGWKGSVAKIAQKTILAMANNYDSKPSDCLVGIGPSIGPCCYEVDQIVVEKLRSNFSDWNDFVTAHNDRWKLNLWAVNQRQLEQIGVKSENIVVSGICTSCNTAVYFSHRAELGTTGRLAAVVSLSL